MYRMSAASPGQPLKTLMKEPLLELERAPQVRAVIQRLSRPHEFLERIYRLQHAARRVADQVEGLIVHHHFIRVQR